MDALTLTIDSHSAGDLDIPLSLEAAGRGLRVGRRPENDWALPDPTRHISGHHFDILYEDGGYVLHDLSTNGTFLNGSTERIPGPHRLTDGDKIRVGAFLIEVALRPLAPDPAPPRPPANVPPAQTGVTGAGSVQAPPGAAFANAAQTGTQNTGALTGRGAQTPDFSRFQAGGAGAARVSAPPVGRPPVAVPPIPVIPAIPEDDPLDDILGAAVPDTEDAAEAVPLPQDAAPKPEPAPEPEAAPAPPPEADAGPDAGANAGALIPDDFDALLDLPPSDVDVPQSAPAARADGPFGAAPAPEPEADPISEIRVETSLDSDSQAPLSLGERFADSQPPVAPPPLVRPEAETPAAPDPAPEPPAAAPAPAPASVSTATPDVAAAPDASAAFLAGFLEGAELDSADGIEIPLHALGQMLGKCARLGTREMMQMLQDRHAVKLFVAQQETTMRIATGNNPMKFLLDADDAFDALFVKPRDGYVSGADGFENALTDIRTHQAAMMAAIQPALGDMLAGLSPSEVEADTGSGGMMGNTARKFWEAYSTRWNDRAAQGENGMLDAFLDAFARRYAEALRSL